jgi:hypothetical protein
MTSEGRDVQFLCLDNPMRRSLGFGLVHPEIGWEIGLRQFHLTRDHLTSEVFELMRVQEGRVQVANLLSEKDLGFFVRLS